MKKVFWKIISLALITALSLTAFQTSVAAPAEQKGIKYTPVVAENGLPVETQIKRDLVTNKISYTYTGRKKISCAFSTPGVDVRAEAEDGLRAWASGDHLTVENVSLTPGDSAIVTVTAKHKDYATVVQEIRITLTTGSPSYPHIVAEADDLLSVTALGLGSSYRQTADIDLGHIAKWTPIGDGYAPFTGTYDGGGFKIKNVNLNGETSDNPALFGRVFGTPSSIKGVNLEGRITSGLVPVSAHGTIVGRLETGMVTDCSFKGEMTLKCSNMTVGGIAASVTGGGRILNCSFDGKIKVTAGDSTRIGGIVGLLEGFADNCVFTGQLITEGVNVSLGGIAGVSRGEISNSAVKADLEKYGADGVFGGLAGDNYSKIYNSAFAGKVYLKGLGGFSGGITGNNYGTVTDTAMKGSVRFLGDLKYVGGIAGRNHGGLIEASSSEAEISGDGYGALTGGIAGENYSYINDINAGKAESCMATITGCSFNGNINVNGSNGASGGIAGKNHGYTMRDSKTPKNAQSLITNCVVRAMSITGAKVGRITSENYSTPKSYNDSGVHPVFLSDNAALLSVQVNGSAVAQKTTGSNINGLGMAEDELSAFEMANLKPPSALELLK